MNFQKKGYQDLHGMSFLLRRIIAYLVCNVRNIPASVCASKKGPIQAVEC